MAESWYIKKIEEGGSQMPKKRKRLHNLCIALNSMNYASFNLPCWWFSQAIKEQPCFLSWFWFKISLFSETNIDWCSPNVGFHIIIFVNIGRERLLRKNTQSAKTTSSETRLRIALQLHNCHSWTVWSSVNCVLTKFGRLRLLLLMRTGAMYSSHTWRKQTMDSKLIV